MRTKRSRSAKPPIRCPINLCPSHPQTRPMPHGAEVVRPPELPVVVWSGDPLEICLNGLRCETGHLQWSSQGVSGVKYKPLRDLLVKCLKHDVETIYSDTLQGFLVWSIYFPSATRGDCMLHRCSPPPPPPPPSQHSLSALDEAFKELLILQNGQSDPSNFSSYQLYFVQPFSLLQLQ